MKLRPLLLIGWTFTLLLVSAVPVRADLSSKQARSLITKAFGMSLPSGAVRVGRIELSSDNAAEATADIDLVFRLTKKQSGWRVSEVRVGPDRWEDLSVIASALGVELPTGACNRVDQFQPGAASRINVKRARCLIAELWGVGLPSDDVRIKSLSGLGVPLASEESAITVAQVRLAIRFAKRVKGWQISEVRSGNRNWSNIENVPGAIANIKRSKATEDMKVLAAALDQFRRERGSFVVTDKHPALIDNLSPRYLLRVIRLDPWQNPYQYLGERGHFTLRSAGPDGKLDTADDIVLSQP
jgi:Type II secretion system (T2SS), protein G